jgi:hypothetical protein
VTSRTWQKEDSETVEAKTTQLIPSCDTVPVCVQTRYVLKYRSQDHEVALKVTDDKQVSARGGLATRQQPDLSMCMTLRCE